MDPETFEQIELSAETIGDVKNYLTAGGKVDVLFVDEKPLTVELPSTVALKVVESSDGVKGLPRRGRPEFPYARSADNSA